MTWGPTGSRSPGPPESVEDPAITLDRASTLIADLGFIGVPNAAGYPNPGFMLDGDDP